MSFNKIILLAAILLASCTSKKQQHAITWLYGYGQVEKLNGTVKSVIEKRGKNEDFGFYYVTYFDRRGNVTDLQKVYKDGTYVTKCSTLYDTKGKKVEAIHIYKDVAGDTTGKIKERIFKEIFRYDNSQHITRCIRNANDPSTDTDRFIYDNAGDLIEEQTYFAKKPIWIFKFKYFNNNNEVCTGCEQSMTASRDNFKHVGMDTTRYIVFDFNHNWLKSVNFLNDTITRKITYY